jgi:hypothetical protein
VETLNIHTLGPGGTSSEQVGLYIASRVKVARVRVMLHPSFEAACQEVQTHGAEPTALLVANAYPNVSRFYMNPALRLVGCLIRDTPMYGLASRMPLDELRHSTAPLEVASHPSPMPMLSEITPTELAGHELRLHPAASTSAAAKLVRDGQFALCITNDISARFFELRFVGSTRAITMVWSVFCEAGGFPKCLPLFRAALPYLNSHEHFAHDIEGALEC